MTISLEGKVRGYVQYRWRHAERISHAMIYNDVFIDWRQAITSTIYSITPQEIKVTQACVFPVRRIWECFRGEEEVSSFKGQATKVKALETLMLTPFHIPLQQVKIIGFLLVPHQSLDLGKVVL